MKLTLFVLVIFISGWLNAQVNDNFAGIQFVRGMNWKQVKEKAIVEKKYIFLDCYATWCGPCKKMDKNIYPLESVGRIFNEKFISVKVQMDSTKDDKEYIKDWYVDAKSICKEYEVNALPTYLFFTPEGELVHKAVGELDSTGFISLAKSALDPSAQYFRLLELYKNGKINPVYLKELTIMSYSFGDYKLSEQIAKNTIKNFTKKELSSKENIEFILYYAKENRLAKRMADRYINSLTEKDKYTKSNLEFIKLFTGSSKDKGFALFYNHSQKVDSINGRKGYSSGHIDYIIAKEEIDPRVTAASKLGIEPDWDHMTDVITNQYSVDYAYRTIAASKLRWYRYQKNHAKVVSILIQYVEKGLKTIDNWHLNNYAWEVFLYSNKKEELEKALEWSSLCIKMDSTYSNSYDTYANILYKLGRVSEAIIWEEKASIVDKSVDEYRNVINKMKKGEPTWPLDIIN